MKPDQKLATQGAVVVIKSVDKNMLFLASTNAGMEPHGYVSGVISFAKPYTKQGVEPSRMLQFVPRPPQRSSDAILRRLAFAQARA